MWPALHVPLLGVTVVPYDVFRHAAELFAVALGTIVNRRQGIPARVTIGIALLCVPVGVWGSRLLDMAEYASSTPSLDALVARNGSSIYGGMIGSFVVVAIVTRLARVPLLAFLDGAAPALALGEAVSRLGCFSAGCCYGVASNLPWAVQFPPGSMAFRDQLAAGMIGPEATLSLAVHPVQLYGFVLMIGCAIFLMRRLPRRAHDGELFFVFLIAYGAYRLAMAPLRAEALASMKLLSLAFIATGAAGLAVRRRAPVMTSVTTASRP